MDGHITIQTMSKSGLLPNNDDFHLVFLQFEAVCRVSAHEMGHALGLIDTTHLGGMRNMHTPGAENQSKKMNVSTDLEWLFKPHQSVGWRTLNSQYLEFVLPIPQ